MSSLRAKRSTKRPPRESPHQPQVGPANLHNRDPKSIGEVDHQVGRLVPPTDGVQASSSHQRLGPSCDKVHLPRQLVHPPPRLPDVDVQVHVLAELVEPREAFLHGGLGVRRDLPEKPRPAQIQELLGSTREALLPARPRGEGQLGHQGVLLHHFAATCTDGIATGRILYEGCAVATWATLHRAGRREQTLKAGNGGHLA
eukprot:CAMPEP_0177402626 /NCGR_PEP_ID=MMETSP0368-20130122/60342_1 /TAXON_ID=447022 ORGANISM="Scrippsiella hangoei-like, Strain SHHI-4" /NCGR_SAMPLE_ID=MMETSP0368 /ASSEMBLY_ACC=CAM_ASM_000363 /LENGTH=199 /DNA_ID=CAMNT_0018870403 /DNA_START=75 /DNA_END=670 /DNA_ORIENTATION=-